MITFREFSVMREGFRLEIPDLRLSGGRNFVVGRNGSGKSTLLHSIAGLIKGKGIIEINGVNINDLPPEDRKVGLIPQDLLLFGRLSVENNLKASVKYAHGNLDIYREIVEELHIKSLLPRKASEISIGQAQKVAIARALISEPSLLLMDEPFSFQDEISRLGMISIIDEYSKRYGFEYLYATHNSRDLDNGFSNLVSLDSGEVVEAVDSFNGIQHFRTFSLLDYRNLISNEGHYYLLGDESLDFNDQSGNQYEIVGNDSKRYIRFKLGGEFFFASPSKEINGKFVKIDLSKAKEILY